MASEFATPKDVQKLNDRLDRIVEQSNEIKRNMRDYIDDENDKQTKQLTDIEKRLTDLIDTKVKNYDKLVRKVVVQEFAKIGK